MGVDMNGFIFYSLYCFFTVFIWCIFCAMQKYIFNIEVDSYLMLYGFASGLFSFMPASFLMVSIEDWWNYRKK